MIISSIFFNFIISCFQTIQSFTAEFWTLEFQKFWTHNAKAMVKHKKANIAVTYKKPYGHLKFRVL
jgi:hypothetical protein